MPETGFRRYDGGYANVSPQTGIAHGPLGDTYADEKVDLLWSADLPAVRTVGSRLLGNDGRRRLLKVWVYSSGNPSCWPPTPQST